MKILIIQLGRIGDMILLSSAFSAIREKYPHAEIHVIASRSNYLIVENHKFISNVFVYKKNPIEILELIYSLRREKYDYYIDPKDHYSTESRIFAKIVKAKIKIGYNDINKKQVFDFSIPSQSENLRLTFIKQIINSLKPLGISKEENILPVLSENLDSLGYVDKFLKTQILGRFIVINISAHTENRLWQKEKWIELVKYLENIKVKIIINSSPEHKELAKSIADSSNNATVFPSRSILDMISLVARSWFIISPDTAAIHIAGAYNKPVIALYGINPIPLVKFPPLSDNNIIVCPKEGEFVSDINVAEVIDAIERLIY